MTEQVKIENARYARTKMRTGRIKYEAGTRSAYIDAANPVPTWSNACDIAREWVTGEESGRTWKHTAREMG